MPIEFDKNKIEPAKTRNSIKKNIQSVTYNFISKFQRIPFNYMSEFDIQAELFCQIRNQLQFSVGLRKDSDQYFHELYNITQRINLVNTEYMEKFDIACIDPFCASIEVYQNKDNDKNLSNYLWRIPLVACMEIKYVRYDDNKQGFSLCLKDSSKLTKFADSQYTEYYLKPDWFMLCFFQNPKALVKMLNDDLLEGIESNKLESKLPEFNKIYLISTEDVYQITPK